MNNTSNVNAYFTYFTNALILSSGVLNATGTRWTNNRRFVLHNLRNLGMGKSYIEDSINMEVKMLIAQLEKNFLNKPSRLEFELNIAILNVVWAMIAGKIQYIEK